MDKRSDQERSDQERSDHKQQQSRETKIEQIIAALISAEYGLSDGYGFYTKDVEATLRHIAIDILNKIDDATIT